MYVRRNKFMLGLLGALLAIGSGVKQSVENACIDENLKQNAIRNKRPYYQNGNGKWYMTETGEQVKLWAAGNGVVCFSVATGNIVYKAPGAKLDRLPWTWMPEVYRKY